MEVQPAGRPPVPGSEASTEVAGSRDEGVRDWSADELDTAGEAAWWRCETHEAVRLKQRAHVAHLESGAVRRAAMTAWWLFYGHLYWGERSQATGWLRRMRRHLETLPVGGEHGYLAFAEAELALFRGELDEAERSALEATALGQRFEDPNVLAMGLQVQGRVLIARGEVEDGCVLLDEAMTLVVVGEISQLLTGSVYCSVIHTCRDLADLPRAVEWTEAMRSWYERLPAPTPYHGLCRVYRGEVLGLCGRWAEAEEDLRWAAALLADLRPRAAAEAFYAIGELCRRAGRIADADQAFVQAQALGRDPQPGRSLLLLAQGRFDAAAVALDASLTRPPREPALRARLLEAQVELGIAAGSVAAARAAADELSSMADRLGGGWLRALAAGSSGAVRVAEGDVHAGVADLRTACRLFDELGLPYEEARARLQLGTALRGLGDEDGGRVELTAARDASARLGAQLDQRRAADLLGELPAGLTEREVEVLRLVAAGHTNREIAVRLVLSEHTVRRHLQNIYVKLGVSSRTAASAFAFRHHLA